MLDWELGKNSSLRGCSGIGTGGITVPGVPKNVWMWDLGTWFGGEHGSAGIDDPGELSQLEFHDFKDTGLSKISFPAS